MIVFYLFRITNDDREEEMEENMQQGNANNFRLNFSTYFFKQKFREIAQYFFK